jgi:hypothetical protein
MVVLTTFGRRGACLVALALALAGAGPRAALAATQAERIDALERQLQQSLAQVRQLAARVAQLEGERGMPPKPQAWGDPAPATHTQARVEEHERSITALQDSVNQIAEGLNRHADDDGIPLHGFVDVGAGWSGGNDPQRQRGFTGGSLDLYLTPQVGSRVKSLIELVMEFEDEGHVIDMERMQIGYTVSDSMTLWAGRFHTPFGAWNTSFHHGANLQTSITRPSFVEFEDRGGLLPAHSVGVWANGKLALAGPARLGYDLYVANGPAIRERRLDPNTFNDDNGDKLIGFNLGYEPHGATGGLKVGLHGSTSRVNGYAPGGASLQSTRVRMLGGYLAYESNAWEIFSEYYRFRDADAIGPARWTSQAGFLHVGRTVGAWTPFVRFERALIDPGDNYFRGLRTGRTYSHAVAGVRYALDGNASLKLELRRSRESSATLLDEFGLPLEAEAASYHRALFQYSIAF